LHQGNQSGGGGDNAVRREYKVRTLLEKMHGKLLNLALSLEGQDMVEYALVLGLLSFGVTAATNFLAASLASAFDGISTTLGSYIS